MRLVIKHQLIRIVFPPLLLGITSYAQASGVACTPTSPIADINFGNVDVLALLPADKPNTSNITLNLNCAKQTSGFLTGYACYRIGVGNVTTPLGGGDGYDYRWLSDGAGHYAAIQIYKGSGNSLWGSTTKPSPTSTQLSYTSGVKTESFLFTLPLYAELLNTFPAAGGTATLKGLAPGTYTTTFNDAATNWRAALGAGVNPDCTGASGAGEFQNATFTFKVTATVAPKCLITNDGSIGDLDFGSASTHAAAPSVPNPSTTLSVQCTRTTPYAIGLLPSNGNANGAGIMSAGGSPDTVPYQLRKGPGASAAVWGNTTAPAPGLAGNGVQGTGTGVAVNHIVYGTVAGTNYRGGNYTDTVTVTVNY